MLSRLLAAIVAIPLVPQILKNLIRCCRRDLSGSPKYPDTMLSPQRRSGADRQQSHPIAVRFEFQQVARFKLQFIPKRLRNEDSARLVNGNSCIHSGTRKWEIPTNNPIVAKRCTQLCLFAPYNLHAGTVGDGALQLFQFPLRNLCPITGRVQLEIRFPMRNRFRCVAFALI